jgi:Xaa-Pro dipeptidase
MDIRSISLCVSRAEKYPGECGVFRREDNCLRRATAKQHVQRVAGMLRSEQGLIYLLGQYGLNREDSDQPRTWVQRKYFYYCSGVDVPNCCLTYDIGKDLLTLYIPEIVPERVVWVGRGLTVEEAGER